MAQHLSILWLKFGRTSFGWLTGCFFGLVLCTKLVARDVGRGNTQCTISYNVRSVTFTARTVAALFTCLPRCVEVCSQREVNACWTSALIVDVSSKYIAFLWHTNIHVAYNYGTHTPPLSSVGYTIMSVVSNRIPAVFI